VNLNKSNTKHQVKLEVKPRKTFFSGKKNAGELEYDTPQVLSQGKEKQSSRGSMFGFVAGDEKGKKKLIFEEVE